MATLLNTMWTVTDATIESPFAVNDTLKITLKSGSLIDVNVIHRSSATSATTTYSGKYEAAKNKVTVSKASNDHWELIASETKFRSRCTLYGLRWKDNQPDTMGTWVCDPQT